MPKSPPDRLGRALEAAEKFAARLPPPKPKRGKRILVAWSGEEYQRVFIEIDYAPAGVGFGVGAGVYQ